VAVEWVWCGCNWAEDSHYAIKIQLDTGIQILSMRILPTYSIF